MEIERPALVRRGLRLNYLSIAYMTVEAVVATLAGVIAGSVALVGFGLDSVIELAASGAAQWRLRADIQPARREQVERVTGRAIGWCFVALAAYIMVDSTRSLWLRERPDRSLPGIAILSLSILIMPALARAKRGVANALASRALRAEAMQTSLCAYLSAIALAGIALNAWRGWWWADPVAAIAMVPIILREGVHGLRARSTREDTVPGDHGVSEIATRSSNSV